MVNAKGDKGRGAQKKGVGTLPRSFELTHTFNFKFKRLACFVGVVNHRNITRHCSTRCSVLLTPRTALDQLKMTTKNNVQRLAKPTTSAQHLTPIYPSVRAEPRPRSANRPSIAGNRLYEIRPRRNFIASERSLMRKRMLPARPSWDLPISVGPAHATMLLTSFTSTWSLSLRSVRTSYSPLTCTLVVTFCGRS